MKILTKSFGLLLMGSLFLTSCVKDNVPPTHNPVPPVANAGVNQVLQNAASAQLTGSGISTNGSITSYSWAYVSGPAGFNIVNPASAITTVDNLQDGTYLFSLTVTDSLGLSDADTTSITISALPVVSIALNPDNNPNELNFAVHDGGNACAHGIDIDAGSWSWGGTNVTIRGSLKFDLTAIPASATIVSAKLSLYSNTTPINGDLINANGGMDNSMHIRRISNFWDAAVATWATQPFTTNVNQLIIPHTDQPFLNLVDLDVTAMVQDMQTQGNYGFMMGLENEVWYNIRQFASSVHPDSTLHPRLEVVYQ